MYLQSFKGKFDQGMIEHPKGERNKYFQNFLLRVNSILHLSKIFKKFVLLIYKTATVGIRTFEWSKSRWLPKH